MFCMKIGNIEIKNNCVLAPMAGVTDVAFRELCSFFGAGLTETEMISVKGLKYANKNTKLMLKTFEGEHPVAVQLFGHEPEVFYEVIKSGILDNFDIIDINMGCPAPKIVKNGDGSALLKNKELASKIIKACKEATNKPVTVKFRKGFYESDDILIPFAKMCEESGADAITIHPRTTAQGYSGKIDIKDIEKVKNAVKISVIGNGDVTSKEDFDKMLSICDGVMIGRGAVGHPDIFSKVQNSSKTFSQEFIAQKHLDILRKYYDDEYITKIFKRHAFSYVDDRENATTLRVAIARAQTLSEIEQILFNK